MAMHDHFHAERTQFGECLGRAELYRVGHGKNSDRTVIQGDEDRGGAPGLVRSGKGFKCRDASHTVLLKEGGLADKHAVPGHRASYTPGGGGLEVPGRFEPHPALPSRQDDGVRQWMFAALFQRCGEAQRFGLSRSVHRQHLGEPRLAFGERARFVHDKRVKPSKLLDGFGVADEHTHLRAPSDAHHHAHRGGQPEGARGTQ